ncbi:hypothetical protein ACQ3I4_09580 [Zafaria sp. Z1313]|uniref:hypothetical protein n=1 Tax=unclassified Zafaria TaxID=2828765 RepID=UPI002E791754|nr:hypothetical protein [Zafaria sp. J156]MEE1621831.1 hypothetical protein [Zafaria sp. J156]
MPEGSKIHNAVAENVIPYADLVQASVSDLETAFGTFASRLSEFKPKWEDIKQRVADYNALEAQPTDPEDREDGTSYRTAYKTSTLQQEVDSAADDYKGYVDACVEAIENADPSADPEWAGSNVNQFITGVKSHWSNARGVMQNIGGFRSVDGKVGFRWSYTNPAPKNISQFLNGKAPWWLPEEAQKRWKATFPHTKSYTSFGLDGVMERLKLKGLYNNADPNFDSFKGIISADGQKVALYFGAGGTTMPGWADKATKKMRAWDAKLTKGLESLQKNKWVKGGGGALAVLDTVSTYKDSYSTAYNDSLRENPGFSPEEHRKEAVTSAAITGTAETAGKVAGGIAGRAAGAAVGQALIPIPGVGAAVGGFVGGIVGEKVGGFLGKEVGNFINDWRKDGAKEALGNLGDRAKDGAKKVLGKLNPFG